MPFPMMLERTFRALVTNVFSPPYSQLLPGPYVPSFNQAGYATQLHRSLASIISEPTSQHFLQVYYTYTKSRTTFIFLSRDAARHFENGQVQGDEDPADHAAHDDHEDGVDGIGQVVRRGVDLGLIERRDFPQHGLQGTRLLANRRHLDDHGGEELRLGHGCAECGAALDGGDDPANGRRNDRVTHRSGHHLQTADEWDAGTKQGRQRVGEAGHGGLEHEGTDDGSLERQVVLPMDALGCAKPPACCKEDSPDHD